MTKELNIETTEESKYEKGMTAINQVFNGALDGEDEDLFGINVIMGTLSLPDKEFKVMGEAIMNELEKALSDPNERMTMLAGLESQGLTSKDALEAFSKIAEQLDSAMQGHFEQGKIDFIKRFFGLLVEGLEATEGIAKRTIPVPISYCREGVQRPRYANDGDAGLDIYALEEYIIQPGETKVIPTGFQVALPTGYEFQIRPRSGQSVKTKLRIANSPGTIDSNYRDEVGVIVENIDPMVKDIKLNEKGQVLEIVRGEPVVIEKGQRFAQMILSEKPTCLFFEVETIGALRHGRAGGFGSTGKF